MQYPPSSTSLRRGTKISWYSKIISEYQDYLEISQGDSACQREWHVVYSLATNGNNPIWSVMGNTLEKQTLKLYVYTCTQTDKHTNGQTLPSALSPCFDGYLALRTHRNKVHWLKYILGLTVITVTNRWAHSSPVCDCVLNQAGGKIYFLQVVQEDSSDACEPLWIHNIFILEDLIFITGAGGLMRPKSAYISIHLMFFGGFPFWWVSVLLMVFILLMLSILSMVLTSSILSPSSIHCKILRRVPQKHIFMRH